MDGKIVKAYNSIVEFVGDLWVVFGNSKATPLALYKRLLDHIKIGNRSAVEKVIGGFEEFYKKYELFVMNDRLEDIPPETKIRYGKSNAVYLELNDFILLSDTETREAIRRHLITISAILEPDDEKMVALEEKINELGFDASTSEGEFITGIMARTELSMKNIDTEDPTQAIMGLMSSGVITDMIYGLQDGITSGKMDMRKLLGGMQTAIGNLLPPEEEASEITELDDASKLD